MPPPQQPQLTPNEALVVLALLAIKIIQFKARDALLLLIACRDLRLVIGMLDGLRDAIASLTQGSLQSRKRRCLLGIYLILTREDLRLH
jgi:hypothetical protein